MILATEKWRNQKRRNENTKKPIKSENCCLEAELIGEPGAALGNVMIDRRKHNRVAVDCWASLRHPLLGTYTAAVEEMSTGGMSLRIDGELYFFVMMELDVRIHGESWDESMPPICAQVLRVNGDRVSLRFPETCDEIGFESLQEEFELVLGDAEELTSPLLFKNSESSRARERVPQRSVSYIGRIESGLR